MTAPLLIPFMPRSNTFGWPPTITGDGHVNTAAPCSYVTVEEALTDDGPTDAHFACYSVPSVAHRLNDGAEERVAGGIPMVLLVFDVDCPKSTRIDGAAPDEWWDYELAKVRRLRAAQPGVVCRRSRGGYRLVGLMPEPHLITDATSKRAWADLYVLAAADLHARHGILADPKCRNWGRLFRAPGAMRDGRREPGLEHGEGDPSAVAAWDLSGLDFAAALDELARLAPMTRAWGEADRSVRLGEPGTVDLPSIGTTDSADPDPDVAQRASLVAELARPVARVREGGGRHTLYLALSGVLLDRGVDPDVLPVLVGELSVRAGVDDARLTHDRVKTARSTVARAASGAPHTRIGELAHGYPEVAAVVDQLLPPRRRRTEEAALRALTRPRTDRAAADAAFGPRPPLDQGSDLEAARIALWELRARGVEVVGARGKMWRCDDGSVWRPDGDRAVELEVHELEGAPFGRRGTFAVNQPKVTGAIRRAAAIVRSDAFFDEPPPGVAFSDGFLTLEGGAPRVEPLRPHHRQTSALPFVWDSRASAPRWDRYLAEVFDGQPDAAGRERLLRQFVGACLMGLATRHKRALVLVGGGDNGKSVFLSVIRELFSDGVVSVPPQRLGSEYYVARLAGARLNLVAEMPRSDVENTEPFKASVSGDVMTGREIREAPFDFVPRLGNVYACNDLPGTSDQSAGWWNRFLVVRFPRRFAEHEQEKGLAAQIVAAEMPGIAAWAVAGALDLGAQGGYSEPESSRLEKLAWARQTDQVALFAEAKLVRLAPGERGDPGDRVYRAFRDWADENGHRPLGSNRFAPRLEALGYARVHGEGGTVWAARLRRSGDVRGALASVS